MKKETDFHYMKLTSQKDKGGTSMSKQDVFGVRSSLNVDGKNYVYYSLKKLEEKGIGFDFPSSLFHQGIT